MKLSAGGKSSHPGRKQVWRIYRQGAATGDVIGLENEPAPPGGSPLLVPVLERGFRLGPPAGLSASRARCERMLAELPLGVRMLEPREAYPVSRSPMLEALTDRTVAALDLVSRRPGADYPKR
jgi:nicotinate phosphoribosyltransferase